MVISGEHRKRLRVNRRILVRTDRAWGYARRKEEETEQAIRDEHFRRLGKEIDNLERPRTALGQRPGGNPQYGYVPTGAGPFAPQFMLVPLMNGEQPLNYNHSSELRLNQNMQNMMNSADLPLLMQDPLPACTGSADENLQILANIYDGIEARAADEARFLSQGGSFADAKKAIMERELRKLLGDRYKDYAAAFDKGSSFENGIWRGIKTAAYETVMTPVRLLASPWEEPFNALDKLGISTPRRMFQEIDRLDRNFYGGLDAQRNQLLTGLDPVSAFGMFHGLAHGEAQGNLSFMVGTIAVGELAALRGASATKSGLESTEFLVSSQRISRYEGYLQKLQATGRYSPERLGEFSGRIHMLEEGYIQARQGKLIGNILNPGSGNGRTGIDRVFRKWNDANDLAVLESKMITGYRGGGDPLKKLNNTLTKGQQMTTQWLDANIDSMRFGPHGSRVNALGEELYTKGYQSRFFNILDERGGRYFYNLDLLGLP